MCEGDMRVANIEDELLHLKNRVEQLEETTQKQSDLLSTLQETVDKLQETTHRQAGLIIYLKKKNRVYGRLIEKQTFMLVKRARKGGHDIGDFDIQNLTKFYTQMNSNKHGDKVIRRISQRKHITLSQGDPIARKERLLLPLPIPAITTETVAFYAYMTSPATNIGPHHVLVFDSVKTNAGNGFHQNTGIFIAPKSGLYVFYWNIRIINEQYHSVELVVNKDQVGVFLQQSTTGHNSQSGNLAVVHVNQGDDVFVRTIANGHVGDVHNDNWGRSSFSGWLL
ncbi:complement C1q tumor necrosis factor-related protein 2-like [Saccostrea echinata]|uniref:complement C1q tumor necrosis factor-related protein 2-like n=1 Tax=Saccostrea echinata TaxID=191078 RepID=UPI002A815F4E|nr:complement C1q tumor necrosis factor-related protein 2-like [Saccostrea echinata]